MIIPEVAPMLTCTAGSDGFLYELVLRADEGKPAITKIRIGPYLFRKDYTPQPMAFGLSRGGPESGFWMHKRAPRAWSRLHWEVPENEPVAPGIQGLFRFVSLFPPGGLRAGLEVYRGEEHWDCGVSGPNYEKFMHGHGH